MGSPSDNPLKRLIREIHRRSLWQVLGIYLVASWAVLQVVDTLEGIVTLPEWFAGLAIGLLVVGLPMVLATAFVQEGGPARDTEDEGVDAPAASTGGAAGLFTWRNALGGGVLAFALLGFVGTGWILFGRGLSTGRAPTSIEQSVAVLPFVNMSADPDNEYFSDGITAELLNVLAQIPDLRVPASTSSFLFKGRDISVREIAEELGVEHIVDGSVRRDGNRVAITAQLVHAQTDTQLWSATFQRELNDIFAIQRDIAAAIADQLRITLSGEEAILVAERPADPEAYDSYLKGRYEMALFMRPAMTRAIEHFQRSIRIDPGYAPAHAALSIAYTLFSQPLGGMPNLEGLPLARAAAERALDLDPQLSEAHVGLGMVHFIYDRDWEAAEQEYRRAVALDLNSRPARTFLGLFLAAMGRSSEAIPELEKAIELDPLSLSTRVASAEGFVHARAFERAIQECRTILELDPGFGRARTYLRRGYEGAGRFDEAIEAYAEGRLLADTSVTAREDIEALRRAHATRGPPGYWEWWLERTGGTGQNRVGALAALHRVDELLAVLEEWDEQRNGGLSFLRTWAYDTVRDDPRFRAVLSRLRLD